jgi:hypothetical protein
MKASWLSTLVVLAAVEGSVPGLQYESLSPSAEPLKAAFNEASGKVRAILLVAPT